MGSDCKGADGLQSLKYFVSGPLRKNVLTSTLEPHLEKSLDILVLRSPVSQYKPEVPVEAGVGCRVQMVRDR